MKGLRKLLFVIVIFLCSVVVIPYFLRIIHCETNKPNITLCVFKPALKKGNIFNITALFNVRHRIGHTYAEL